MAASPTISAILVSYNTRDMTLRCLADLKAEIQNAGLGAEIIVIDNASTDGTAEAVQAAYPEIILHASPQNLGFGRANNWGFARARGKFLLLLNTDAFLQTGALAALLEAATQHPEAGVIAPRLVNDDGSMQRSCWPYPTPLSSWLDNSGLNAILRRLQIVRDTHNWGHDEEKLVDWAIGACLLVHREVYEKVGGFDESFWMYSEETDWQMRMREAGYQIFFTPAAVVTHLGGGSGGDAVKDAVFQSLDQYMVKHYGKGGALAVRGAMVWGNLLRLPMWALLAALFPRQKKFRQKLRLTLFLILRQGTRRLC